MRTLIIDSTKMLLDNNTVSPVAQNKQYNGEFYCLA